MRALAALALTASMLAVPVCAVADPPLGEPWQQTFDEEFNGMSLDATMWSTETGPVERHQPTTWLPDDLSVATGTAQFSTHRDQRNGTAWTNARITTKTFHQKYGYVEARIRSGGAHGIFGLVSDDAAHPFEIDIAELGPSNHLTVGVHRPRALDALSNDTRSLQVNDANAYHIYGVAWTPNLVQWFVDGRLVHAHACPFCAAPANIRLGTIVTASDRRTVDLDGTSLDVDWIRGYARDRP